MEIKRTFKNEEEAKAELEKLEKNYVPDWFCPLINTHCRMDCLCFNNFFVFTDHNKAIKVGGGYCTNKMMVEL